VEQVRAIRKRRGGVHEKQVRVKKGTQEEAARMRGGKNTAIWK
jgi:hypothetical protein